MAIEHREPDGDLVAERDRQRVLQMRAAGHGRVAVLPGEASERPPHCGELRLDDPERVAHLQHDRRVHHILSRRTPMDVSARFAGDLRELMNERQNGEADVGGLAPERVEIDRVEPGVRRDLSCGCFRNHAARGFGAREGDFDVDVAPDERALVEDAAHFRSAEEIEHRTAADAALLRAGGLGAVLRLVLRFDRRKDRRKDVGQLLNGLLCKKAGQPRKRVDRRQVQVLGATARRLWREHSRLEQKIHERG